jgi:Uma2 family endonuclease
MPRHQRVQMRLGEWLDEHSESIGGFAVDSPIDIVFSEHDVLQPDVVFFRPERAHLIDLDRVIRHAPDLCVEILSPSTEATDRGRKMQMFARYGVPEYWIVDPAQEVLEVLRLEAGSYVLAQRAAGDAAVESAVVPGTALRAGSIFP